MTRFQAPPGPVRDIEGHIVYLVRVRPHELTCTRCGDDIIGDHCVICDHEADRTPGYLASIQQYLVPTTSYLHPDEYRLIA